MNVAIDMGNTRIKVGLFEKNELKKIDFFPAGSLGELNGLLTYNSIEKAVISTVTIDTKPVVDLLKVKTGFILEYNSQTLLPIKNLYKTPHTLGGDRIPPVIAAWAQFPDSDVLVIDAGTCIKYNFLNKAGEYLGGAISPGLAMRFKALHTFTARLPLVEPDQEYDKLIGGDTHESILSGVQTAAVAEVEGIINRYKQQYPELKIMLTGGDQAFFEKRLKNAIFADPYLVLKGLNIILNYNA